LFLTADRCLQVVAFGFVEDVCDAFNTYLRRLHFQQGRRKGQNFQSFVFVHGGIRARYNKQDEIQHLSLFPALGGAITGWLYHPKWKQLEMASYPKLTTEDATGEHYEGEDEQGGLTSQHGSLKLIISVVSCIHN